MEKGYIKMFDDLKGFGFIVTEDDDELYFSKQDIHPKSGNVRIREGMEVGFDLKREMKGDRAVNVRIFEK
ncbi:MAG: cold shock domain-containing protein [Phycisphaerae bacterium]|nr:cold shock domain-containing protein [Phycisphaerae bacterium]NIU55369.1 cold shock domain-containing protein [Phycisphaerae bacterium]NIW91836.1 cold shock domain-containing protein [Phycisphaerae bacterium]